MDFIQFTKLLEMQRVKQKPKEVECRNIKEKTSCDAQNDVSWIIVIKTIRRTVIKLRTVIQSSYNLRKNQ